MINHNLLNHHVLRLGHHVNLHGIVVGEDENKIIIEFISNEGKPLFKKIFTLEQVCGDKWIFFPTEESYNKEVPNFV